VGGGLLFLLRRVGRLSPTHFTHSIRMSSTVWRPPLWLIQHLANKTMPIGVKRQVPNIFPEVDWRSRARGLWPGFTEIKHTVQSQRLDGKVLNSAAPASSCIASTPPRCSFLLPCTVSSLSISLSPFSLLYQAALPSSFCDSYALAWGHGNGTPDSHRQSVPQLPSQTKHLS